MLERGDVQPVGTTIGYEAADNVSDDYVRLTTGFLVPTRYDYVHAGTRIGTLFQEQAMFDASSYLVAARTAVSRDGTPIDYYLLRPKKITHPGETPTLITGYGAFNVTFQPDYLGPDEGGRSFLSWLSRGGALALASVRGGGDRGAEWHEAAMEFTASVPMTISWRSLLISSMGLPRLITWVCLAAQMGACWPQPSPSRGLICMEQ